MEFQLAVETMPTSSATTIGPLRWPQVGVKDARCIAAKDRHGTRHRRGAGQRRRGRGAGGRRRLSADAAHAAQDSATSAIERRPADKKARPETGKEQLARLGGVGRHAIEDSAGSGAGISTPISQEDAWHRGRAAIGLAGSRYSPWREDAGMAPIAKVVATDEPETEANIMQVSRRLAASPP